MSRLTAIFQPSAGRQDHPADRRTPSSKWNPRRWSSKKQLAGRQGLWQRQESLPRTMVGAVLRSRVCEFSPHDAVTPGKGILRHMKRITSAIALMLFAATAKPENRLRTTLTALLGTATAVGQGRPRLYADPQGLGEQRCFQVHRFPTQWFN